jgi:LCP family protein required for cell wall assembly
MKKALIVATVFFAVIFAYFIKSGLDFYKGIYRKFPAGGGFEIPKEKTEYNVLLMGFGGPGHEGPYLTDSMMVVHIDIRKNKVALLSLPRDLWYKLPTKSKENFHAKINAIYQLGLFPTEYPDVDTVTYPDVSLVMKAVSDITGLSIDNYMTVDFTGFIKGIDILGGVVVDVQNTFDDYEYPIEGKEKDLCGRESEFIQVEKFLKPGFDQGERQQLFKDKPELEQFYKSITEDPKVAFPCRYERLHFDAGRVFMNGETALKYVRSRHSSQDGTDFGRGGRQQQFIKAVKDKAVSIGTITKIIPLLDELKKHIQTDISIDDMKRLMGEIKDAGTYKILNINMSDKDYLKNAYSDDGQYILISREGEDKWGLIHTAIQNGIDEITPTPSPQPTGRVIPTENSKK